VPHSRPAFLETSIEAITKLAIRQLLAHAVILLPISGHPDTEQEGFQTSPLGAFQPVGLL
jgi:hypothetical protein